MRSVYCVHRYFKFSIDFVSIGGNYPKGLRSLHQFKQTKLNTQRYRKITKPVEQEDVNPKVFMRDKIANVYSILKYSSWDSAQQQIEKSSLKWDSYTVNQVLKTHPPMEKAWLFFNWVSRTKGFKHDHFTYTTMLDIFGEAKRIESMKYVFEQMREKGIKIDAVTYTSVMHWLSNCGDVEGAVKVWEEMKEKERYPTVVSYTAYMKILFVNNRVKEATDVYKEMLETGLSPNCHTYTVLMDYLVGSGKYDEALEIFSKMQEAGVQPDKAACNILVEKCCKVGETRTMIQILKYMKENYLVLRYPVFLEALQTLKVARESDVLLRKIHPHFSAESINNEEAVEFARTDAEVPLSLDGGLLLFLLKKQSLVAIDHLLAGMMDKNIQLESATMSTIIKEACDCGRPDGALSAFKYSSKLGVNLERITYLALLGISTRSDSLSEVVEIFKQMTKAGHSLGVYHGALLIYRLGCARRPAFAAKIFNLLPKDQKCTATFTALIGVYFSAGSADKALKIYKTMQNKGIHPSLGTYNVLLAGLEKLGRVSDAETFRKERKSMQADSHSRDTVPLEEKICDLLFGGDVMS
ncbi:hypothetical protein Pint_28210 [Pistacia integerrima]|uniref:Uncharacterized protein n=1 Tax=Pistacia integerrima TaxID=434235 RepID=A0ACC0YUD4_9ROSI|nr:hypothetical protein Pint_28210 [Pistacia integerrima]